MNAIASGGSSSATGVGAGQGSAPGLLSTCSQSFTELPIIRFTHLWTIKQFPLIPTEMERLCSPWFSPPKSKDLWFLKLRLKAVDEGLNQEFVGVHLFLRQSGEKKTEVRAHYTISVLDSLGNKRYTGECSKPEGRVFKAGTEGHGYKLLCPRDNILKAENKLLGPESSLNIRCEVTVFGDLVNVPSTSSLLEKEVDMTSNTLAVDLKHLFDNDIGGDVDLIGKDGQSVKAHKAILMARSAVFRAMFEHETVEKKENKITLDDMDFAVIKQMVTFMYTDDVKPTDLTQWAEELLWASDRYDIKKLKAICEKHLIERLNEANAGQFLAVADMTNATKLREVAIDYIAANPMEVLETEGWEKQVSKRPILYKEAFHALAKKQRKK